MDKQPPPLPTYLCPKVPAFAIDGKLRPGAWRQAKAARLLSATGKPQRLQPTTVRATWSDTHLYVAFRCTDSEIRSTHTKRDDPLYEEDVVEIFLCLDGDLSRYIELEFSPKGTIFDARVTNATGAHDGIKVDTTWDCQGLECKTQRINKANGELDYWTAEVAIPFAGLGVAPPKAGAKWRANFYRIDYSAKTEFSAFSPTLANPASYHVPSRFGWLEFVESNRVAPRVAAPKLEHTIVAGMPERFAGWPANNGVWSWDGKEILVGFSDGAFVEQAGHNIEGLSDTASTVQSLLARSGDGGRTWRIERPNPYVAFHAQYAASPGNIRFGDPNFAMRVLGIGYHGTQNPQGGFYCSYDRGKTWQGAYRFGDLMSDPNLRGWECTARTGYLVTGTDSCLVFLSARPKQNGGGRDKAFCAETTDGGKTFRFLSWIVPLADPYRAVMPAVVRQKEGRIVAALRRRNPNDGAASCWVDAYASTDGGKTWAFLSRVGETGGYNGNPPALAALKDGRLCCVYGDRTRVKLLARLSADGGKTWGEEEILREDFHADRFGDKDFGYPRLILVSDGALVALYYWATQERPQQHIAATRWKPAPRR